MEPWRHTSYHIVLIYVHSDLTQAAINQLRVLLWQLWGWYLKTWNGNADQINRQTMSLVKRAVLDFIWLPWFQSAVFINLQERRVTGSECSSCFIKSHIYFLFIFLLRYVATYLTDVLSLWLVGAVGARNDMRSTLTNGLDQHDRDLNPGSFYLDPSATHWAIPPAYHIF